MGDVYGLHHGLLNVEVPPKTMWMNLGFWTKPSSTDDRTITQRFEMACQALLDTLLLEYGCLEKVNSSALSVKDRMQRSRRRQPLKIIDLGIGCGDQTLRIFRHWNFETEYDIQAAGINYIGITNNASQCDLASKRLQALKLPLDFQVALTCVDAAKPEVWPESLIEASSKIVDENVHEEVLVVALDCLYHFRPSRERLFSYAYSKAQASILAFDLMLAAKTTILQRLLLWFVCVLLRVPFSNFVTIDEYTAQLARAGYAYGNVRITDISENVFFPLSENLYDRHKEMKKYGLGGLGVYRIAALIFRWFGTSGVVRGCIVRAER